MNENGILMAYDSTFPAISLFSFQMMYKSGIPKAHFCDFYSLSLEKCLTQGFQQDLLPWIK